MSKRLPPLNALRVFDAAARHLSFTRAAEELFVTQAAVSHQIKSLEDFLGLKLFRRRNRSLLLTEEGQSYFLDIKEIFSQLTEATRKLQARSATGQLAGATGGKTLRRIFIAGVFAATADWRKTLEDPGGSG